MLPHAGRRARRGGPDTANLLRKGEDMCVQTVVAAQPGWYAAIAWGSRDADAERKPILAWETRTDGGCGTPFVLVDLGTDGQFVQNLADDDAEWAGYCYGVFHPTEKPEPED